MTAEVGRIRVSADRLLGDLEALARFGARPDGGVDRVAGSEADLAARRWLLGRMEEVGLQAWTDDTMNVFGHVRDTRGPWLLVGSHTDTVPAGGRLDGAYGVIAALEVLRTLIEAEHPVARCVEVVSFYDEEGVRSGGLTGSRALLASEHVHDLIGYLEIHIEQGPRLENEGLELGVVEGIVGVERWDVSIIGAANHAGTTPLSLRHDAARAASRVILAVWDIVRQVHPDMVGNIGVVEVSPNSPNVVPGEAHLVVELRAFSVEDLRVAADRVHEAVTAACAAEQCDFALSPRAPIAPQPMDATMVTLLSEVCGQSGRPWRRMLSGAGHDAGSLAAAIPAGMLFVPSHAGISHSPEEHTDEQLLVQGTQTLLDACLAVIQQREMVNHAG